MPKWRIILDKPFNETLRMWFKTMNPLRPIDLARSVGMSAQTIRVYESWGLIPASVRGPNGYRQYTQLHLQALEAVRSMAAAYGIKDTATIMNAVHRREIETALELIDAIHGAFHRERQETKETVSVLRSITGEEKGVTKNNIRTYDNWHIRKVANHLGIRESTLRFWESEGLIEPIRQSSSGYRLYNAETIRMIRVIHNLRKANYGLDAIRPVLSELKDGNPERALEVAENRLFDLMERSRRGVLAMGALSAYITELAQRNLL